ncbi:MAG TPA: DNA repair exonuclease [Candidatus Bilamarchaeum sp.]|nr:DNA repair exonuclease [Candidatus Bilamarchaeum sp.]
MKIAVFSDPHLGYARFEEDSYIQAERAILSANEKADLILCAGDIFDVKIPKLETLKRAVEIFRKAKKPLFAIHGNHERRAKDLVNPAQLLESGSGIRLLHGKSAIFEKDGERIQVLGVGSVPEEYAQTALKKIMEGFRKEEGAFAILMLHQTIKELVPGAEEEISLDYLETLPFDLIIDGHIHETIVKLGGRFLIPGSTVITQLKKDEMAPKGYFLYDTKTRKAEFIEIPSRKFFYEVLEFKDATEPDVKQAVTDRIKGIRDLHPDAVIAIKIDGSLKGGLSKGDIHVEGYANVFIDNRLSTENLGSKLEKIRASREEAVSFREMAMKDLKAKTAGKITLFEPVELFDKLAESPEAGLEYIEKNKKDKQ